MSDQKQYVSKREHILSLIKKKRKLMREDVLRIASEVGASDKYVRKVFRDKQAEKAGKARQPKLIGNGKAFRKEVADTYAYLCKQYDDIYTWDDFIASSDYKKIRLRYAEVLNKNTLNVYTGQVYKEIFFKNPDSSRVITEKQINTIVYYLRLVGYLTSEKEEEIREAIKQAGLRAYEGIQLIAFLRKMHHLTKVADSKFGHYIVLPLLAGLDRVKLVSKIENKQK